MKIIKKVIYCVDGKNFDTLANAQDHVDGLIHKLLQTELQGKSFGLTGNEIIRVTEAILRNRQYLIQLLDVELPSEED